MNTIRAYASSSAHLIYGTAYDDSLRDKIRVTVLITGLSRQVSRSTSLPIQVAMTGTDDASGLSVASQGSVQSEYSGAQTPSTRSTDRSHATLRGDALSTNTTDDLETPAFLRKQAD
jgi:cell division protein FtsZ